MCLTDNKDLFEKMSLLRDHGMRPEKKYWHEVVGFNYRMTNLQAALGCAQLSRIDSFLEAKKKNALLYQEGLASLPWITFQQVHTDSETNHWLFSILINDQSKYTRDEVLEKLRHQGVDARQVFYPTSHMPPYQVDDTDLDNSITIGYSGLSLPSSSKLTSDDVHYICEILKNI